MKAKQSVGSCSEDFSSRMGRALYIGTKRSRNSVFSGCNLHCCFCQNNSISSKLHGKTVSHQKLADIFLSIEQKGADNIEFVTPTHFVPHIIRALDIAKPRLIILVIYNTGG